MLHDVSVTIPALALIRASASGVVSLSAGRVTRLGCWSPPKEFKLDVVRISKGEHCVPSVLGLFHT